MAWEEGGQYPDLDHEGIPSFAELEGWARRFLTLVGMLPLPEGVVAPLPSRALAALRAAGRVEVRLQAPPLLRGASHRNIIYIDPDTPPEDVEYLIAHEISHWFLSSFSDLTAWQQERSLAGFIACWLMPYDDLVSEVRRRGGFLFAMKSLMLKYAEIMDPRDVLLRAQQVLNIRVILYDYRARVLPFACGLHEVNFVLSEREAREQARGAIEAGKGHVDERGFAVTPLIVNGVMTVVLVVDLTLRELHLSGY